MRLLRNIFETFVQARTMSALYQLSDSQLRDLGIARSDIPKYAENICHV